VDCVVGGRYYKRGTQAIEYLLMGLYDDAGKLSYVADVGSVTKPKRLPSC
jgi:ATP-dependent DNA ligase